MIGISALPFDLHQKLDFINSRSYVDYLEYGVDSVEDISYLQSVWQYLKRPVQLAFHLPLKLNPVEDIGRLRQANLAYGSEIIQEGLKLKPLYFNMHLGHLFQWKYEKEKEYYHRLASDYIQKLLSLDERAVFYLENMYSLTKQKSGDLIAFGKTPEEIGSILSQLSLQRVGFCLDIGHMILSGNDFWEQDFVKGGLLHFNTNHGEWDEHLAFEVEGYDVDFFRQLIDSQKFRYILMELSMEQLLKADEKIKGSGGYVKRK